MAFPTSSLTNNQVHKEGNRAFVYDSALGVWDQVRETDRTDNKILSGEIGSGVTFPAGHLISISTSEYSGGNFNVDSSVQTIISPSVEHTLVATNTYIVKWYGMFIGRLESSSSINRRVHLSYWMGTTERAQTHESGAAGGFGTEIRSSILGAQDLGYGTSGNDGAQVNTDSPIIVIPYGTSGIKYFHITMNADSATHRATVYASGTAKLLFVIETYKGDIT